MMNTKNINQSTMLTNLKMLPRNELEIEILRLEEKSETCPSYSEFPQKKRERLIKLFLQNRRERRLVHEVDMGDDFFDRLCDEEGQEIKDDGSITWAQYPGIDRKMVAKGFYIRRGIYFNHRVHYSDTFFIPGSDTNALIRLVKRSYQNQENATTIEFGSKIVPYHKMSNEELKEEFDFCKKDGYSEELVNICEELFARLK